MRIAIDARWIFPKLSGIGVYTRELIRHLAQIDSNNHYRIFCGSAAVQDALWADNSIAQAKNFSARIIPYGLFSPANQWLLPALLTQERLDVYHSPNYMIPLRAFPRQRSGRIRCLTNIHDLIPLIYPEYAPRARKKRLFWLYRWIMGQVAARSDIILTGSQTARQDILEHLRIAPQRQERVLAIPDGVAAYFRPSARPRPNRPHQVILWVGRADPYKNISGLIEAFAQLRRQNLRPLELRLVGAPDQRYPAPQQLVARLALTDTVHWTGYISDAQLLQEYQQADLFVLPSYYEGFGLPVLEAMACGTPVVCSNKGALPEVADSAALLVEPGDSKALSAAMGRVLNDPTLAQQLSERGLSRAAKFSWTAAARQTLQAYWKALT